MEQMTASSSKPLDLHMLEMDLQNLGNVKTVAEGFMRKESRLDLLINNAGVRTLRPLVEPVPQVTVDLKFADANISLRSWPSHSNSQPTASKPSGKRTTLPTSCLPKLCSQSSSPQPLLPSPKTASASLTCQAMERCYQLHLSNWTWHIQI